MPDIEVTFVARDIESAPKDRDVMLLRGDNWSQGWWCFVNESLNYWYTFTHYAETMEWLQSNPPTHWAEIEDMSPLKSVLGVAGAGVSSQSKPDIFAATYEAVT